MATYKDSKRKYYARKNKNLKTIFFKIIIAIFLIVASISLFYISKFRIKNIKIENNSNLNPRIMEIVKNELNKKVFLFFPYDNIFIFKKESIAKKILKNMNGIKSIKIKRDFTNGLIISFEEKKIVGAYCKTTEEGTEVNKIAEKCFFIDENGDSFQGFGEQEKNKELAEKKIILFEVFPNNPDIANPRFLEQEKFTNLMKFVKDAENIVGLKTEKITIKKEDEEPIQEYEVYFSERSAVDGDKKWYALLDSETNLKLALENLKLILDSNIKEKRNRLEYIDLRLPNKVFFCAQKLCVQN